MTHKRIGAYVGIDPTARSMHVGHLVPMMCLFWLYINGFQSLSLVRTLNHAVSQDLMDSIARGSDGKVWRSNRPVDITRKSAFVSPQSEYGQYACAAEKAVGKCGTTCKKVRVQLGMGMAPRAGK